MEHGGGEPLSAGCQEAKTKRGRQGYGDKIILHGNPMAYFLQLGLLPESTPCSHSTLLCESIMGVIPQGLRTHHFPKVPPLITAALETTLCWDGGTGKVGDFRSEL